METVRHARLDLEYTQINDNIRFLAEVRFKLLALVPTFGGAAVFLLARMGLESNGTPASAAASVLLVVLLVSLIGFLATLGIILYDQRNSELYNALIHRARHLEEQFGVPCAPGGLKHTDFGGQFNERPARRRRFIFEAGHDLALALIYGPLLGTWLFPILYAALRMGGIATGCAQLVAVGAAAVGAFVFSVWLVAIDRQEMELYNLASKVEASAKEP